EPRSRQQAYTYSVRFALVRACEADLLLDGEALCGGYAGHRRIAASRGGADQDGGEHRGRRHQTLAALRGDAARDMPLRDVRDFVGQDARRLAFVLGLEQQPDIHADEAAGQSEGVDGRILDHEEVEALRAVVRMAGQAMAERGDVFGDL